MKKKVRSYRTWIIIGIIVLALALVLIFGTQLYLYLRLLLGNDLLLTLEVDNDRFFLVHGERASLSATIRGTANPFCKATCSIVLKDISTGEIIDNQTFASTLPLQEKKDYTLTAPSSGIGQKLYNVEAQCVSARSTFCRTSGDLKLRSVIIALNYTYTPAEEAFRATVRNELSQALIDTHQKMGSLIQLNTELNQIPLSLNSSLAFTLNDVLFDLNGLNVSLDVLKLQWEKGHEVEAHNGFMSLADDMTSREQDFNVSRLLVLNSFASFNASLLSLTQVGAAFTLIQGINVSDQHALDALNLKANLTALLYPGNTTYSLSYFLMRSTMLAQEGNALYTSIVNEENTSTNTTLSVMMPLVPYSPIVHAEYVTNYTPLFTELAESCCVNGACSICCANCQNDNESYPIILLHGHTFNERISAEFSLDTFGPLQSSLERDYINGGIVLLGAGENDSRGVLGKTHTPMTFRASYYFDIYSNTKDTLFVETKEDNIDSYAIRLRDSIETVRYLTNRDKVVIVAHSMGGLVARRYMQVFGSEAVAKVIFIATPNHGVSGRAEAYCDFLGASAECKDMRSDSLFINKLNRDSVPAIPLENIIGVGCSTDGESGDGIVTNSSAYLNGAVNRYVNVSCNGGLFDFAHTVMVDPRYYPEVYTLVNSSLHNLNL